MIDAARDPTPSQVGQEARRFAGRAVLFVVIGLGLYGALYAGSEALVGRYADRNRFFTVQEADSAYDFVLLGASHAAVFDYRDLNAELEFMTGTRILNLATLGGGVTVNRLLLEYFLESRSTRAVVYILDSFAFYSAAWNEERLRDTELYLRAPLDPALARLLVVHGAGWRTALDYASGFSKINNPARFEPDSFPAEGSTFERSYRPVAQIDRQRVDFLYPDGADLATPTSRRYLAQLEELVDLVRSNGARFAVVRPPIPSRMREMMPGEVAFDRELSQLLARLGVPLLDFSRAIDDPSRYYDSDHLNVDGARAFIEDGLAPALLAIGR